MSWSFWYLVLIMAGQASVVVPIPYGSEERCIQAWEEKRQEAPLYLYAVCVPSDGAPYANGDIRGTGQ